MTLNINLAHTFFFVNPWQTLGRARLLTQDKSPLYFYLFLVHFLQPFVAIATVFSEIINF